MNEDPEETGQGSKEEVQWNAIFDNRNLKLEPLSSTQREKLQTMSSVQCLQATSMTLMKQFLFLDKFAELCKCDESDDGTVHSAMLEEVTASSSQQIGQFLSWNAFYRDIPLIEGLASCDIEGKSPFSEEEKQELKKLRSKTMMEVNARREGLAKFLPKVQELQQQMRELQIILDENKALCDNIRQMEATAPRVTEEEQDIRMSIQQRKDKLTICNVLSSSLSTAISQKNAGCSSFKKIAKRKQL